MKLNVSNKEVLISKTHPFSLNKDDIKIMQSFANLNSSNKSRICSHKNVEDKLHEMFITHKKDYYVRPHRHFNKSESILILKGNADLVLFNEKGDIQNIIQLDEFSSGNIFYNRIDLPIFHSLIIKSNFLLFYEVTTGPLKVEDTEYAKWSPEIGSDKSVEFLNNIKKEIAKKSIL